VRVSWMLSVFLSATIAISRMQWSPVGTS